MSAAEEGAKEGAETEEHGEPQQGGDADPAKVPFPDPNAPKLFHIPPIGNYILDLVGLTVDEDRAMREMMKREDKDMRDVKQKIQLLQGELNTLYAKGIQHLENAKPGKLSHYCVRCTHRFKAWRRVLPMADSGKECMRCHLNICKKCRIKQSNGRWLCNVCVRLREMSQLTGQWSCPGGVGLSGSDVLKLSLRDRYYFLKKHQQRMKRLNEMKRQKEAEQEAARAAAKAAKAAKAKEKKGKKGKKDKKGKKGKGKKKGKKKKKGGKGKKGKGKKKKGKGKKSKHKKKGKGAKKGKGGGKKKGKEKKKGKGAKKEKGKKKDAGKKKDPGKKKDAGKKKGGAKPAKKNKSKNKGDELPWTENDGVPEQSKNAIGPCADLASYHSVNDKKFNNEFDYSTRNEIDSGEIEARRQINDSNYAEIYKSLFPTSTTTVCKSTEEQEQEKWTRKEIVKNNDLHQTSCRFYLDENRERSKRSSRCQSEDGTRVCTDRVTFKDSFGQVRVHLPEHNEEKLHRAHHSRAITSLPNIKSHRQPQLLKLDKNQINYELRTEANNYRRPCKPPQEASDFDDDATRLESMCDNKDVEDVHNSVTVNARETVSSGLLTTHAGSFESLHMLGAVEKRRRRDRRQRRRHSSHYAESLNTQREESNKLSREYRTRSYERATSENLGTNLNRYSSTGASDQDGKQELSTVSLSKSFRTNESGDSSMPQADHKGHKNYRTAEIMANDNVSRTSFRDKPKQALLHTRNQKFVSNDKVKRHDREEMQESKSVLFRKEDGDGNTLRLSLRKDVSRSEFEEGKKFQKNKPPQTGEIPVLSAIDTGTSRNLDQTNKESDAMTDSHKLQIKGRRNRCQSDRESPSCTMLKTKLNEKAPQTSSIRTSTKYAISRMSVGHPIDSIRSTADYNINFQVVRSRGDDGAPMTSVVKLPSTESVHKGDRKSKHSHSGAHGDKSGKSKRRHRSHEERAERAERHRRSKSKRERTPSIWDDQPLRSGASATSVREKGHEEESSSFYKDTVAEQVISTFAAAQLGGASPATAAGSTSAPQAPPPPKPVVPMATKESQTKKLKGGLAGLCCPFCKFTVEYGVEY